MANERDDVGASIREVRAATERYAKDLILEVDKLLTLVLTLHAAKASLEEQVALLREEIDRRVERHAVIVEQLTDAEELVRVFSSEYVGVEQANSNLASLYVASRRIHSSLERDEVLSGLKEIIINQIGSEEFAIFERDRLGERWSLIASVGIDPERELDLAAIEDLSTSGTIHVLSASEAEAGAGPRVIIPLKVCGRVTGAIVIYRMLNHRGALEWVENELLKLLSAHAGLALYASSLHAQQRSQEVAR
jgi:hypothetical protein